MNWYQMYHQVEHSFIQTYQKPTQIQGTSMLICCLSEQKNALLNAVLQMLLPGKVWTEKVSQLPCFKTFPLVSIDKSVSCAALSYDTITLQQVLFLGCHWLFHFNTKHLWSCYSTVACKMWKKTEDITDEKTTSSQRISTFSDHVNLWNSLFVQWMGQLFKTGQDLTGDC